MQDGIYNEEGTVPVLRVAVRIVQRRFVILAAIGQDTRRIELVLVPRVLGRYRRVRDYLRATY